MITMLKAIECNKLIIIRTCYTLQTLKIIQIIKILATW